MRLQSLNPHWNSRLLFYVFLVLLSLSSPTFCWSQIDLIDAGSNWTYFDAGMMPPAQGDTTWIDSTYNVSGWNIGPAELGYGDNDENTTISNSALTAYFLQEFDVTNPDTFSLLSLNLTYDDGAVVYLNESEIWRVNMPTGSINYNTFASNNSGDNAQASTLVSADSLVPGTNYLAVEVHQRSAGSSDLSFDLSMTGTIPGLISLVRGPYLQMGCPNSMTIKWRTSEPAISILHYGNTIDSLNYIQVDSTLKINHEIVVNNLTEDTKYFYEISTEQSILISKAADLYFQTSPLEGSIQKIRAWILGDPGTANNNARAVRDAYYAYVDSLHTDMILFLGDNAYTDGTDAEYQFAVFENMYEEKLKNSVAWSTLGNHDGHSADSETQTGPYYEIFSLPKNAECGGMASGTEAYYSFDYGNVHFIILDSYDSNRSVGGPMYNWCLEDLQNTMAEWIVGIWHHPAYTKGSHDSDTEGQLIDMRENFLPLLEEYGIDVVLSGHSHSYERSYFINRHYEISDSFNSTNNTVGITGDGDGRIAGDGAYQKTYCQDEGAVYVTAGSSGKTSSGDLDHEAMFISVSELGSCVMEVEGDEMKFKFIRENGLVRDSFSIIKINCDTTSTSFCAFVSSSYGDVEEQPDGTIYQESSDLELTYDNSSNEQVIGLVFEDIQIRRGSSIQSAYVQFTADKDTTDISADSSYLIIEGFLLDHTTLFSEDSFDVSSRPVTTNKVVWQPEAWLVPNERDSLQRSPDLSFIIQEILNQNDFRKGNNIGFRITGFGKRSAASLEAPGSALPPELCITYTNCFDSLEVENIIPLNPSHIAQESVISSGIFPPGNALKFSAGSVVELQPNFEIPLGREFLISILGCIQY